MRQKQLFAFGVLLVAFLIASPVFGEIIPRNPGERYEPSWGGLFTMPEGYQGIEFDYVEPMPIAAMTAPVWMGGSPSYEGWSGEYLGDDELDSQWVTDGFYATFHWEFDFSYYSNVPKDIVGFVHLQRAPGSNGDVASATLTFSDDSDFTTVIETITIDTFETGDTPTVVIFPTVTARYVRFDGIPVGDQWAGGREIMFLAADDTPSLLLGDANRDGVVSAGDYASVQQNFGLVGEIGILGDASLDGVVSAGDYSSVQANFGNSLPLAGAVPEPTTMLMLLLGSAGLAVRRRIK